MPVIDFRAAAWGFLADGFAGDALENFGAAIDGPCVLLPPRGLIPHMDNRHRVAAAELPIEGKAP
ncbi:MAG: hypothetical protein IPI73_26320 [Betaproteobacteria bacterium]|nr:hypothetical protein [Betaproteobacteria bacterium]